MKTFVPGQTSLSLKTRNYCGLNFKDKSPVIWVMFCLEVNQMPRHSLMRSIKPIHYGYDVMKRGGMIADRRSGELGSDGILKY